MTPLIVTGCPRSGTAWITRALTRAGLPTQHEQALTAGRPRVTPDTVESSWLAVPHLQPHWTVGVQVRHPIAVARSIWRLHIFAGDGDRHGKWAARHVRLDGTEQERITDFIIAWSDLALEAAAEWWRLEDPTKYPAVLRLIESSGRQVDPKRLRHALASTPAANHKPRFTREPPPHRWPNRLAELAAQLGYPRETT